MISIKTNLKQIPKKCTKCKFSGLKGVYSNNYNDFFNPTLIKKVRYCKITNKEVPYVFNKDKNNWEYTKCKNCPLIDSERTMEI